MALHCIALRDIIYFREDEVLLLDSFIEEV